MFTIGFPQRCTMDSHTLLYRGKTFKADCTRSYEAKATMAGCMLWGAIMAVQWRDRGTLYRSMAVFGLHSVKGHNGCPMAWPWGLYSTWLYLVVQYQGPWWPTVQLWETISAVQWRDHGGCTVVWIYLVVQYLGPWMPTVQSEMQKDNFFTRARFEPK